MFFRTAVLVFTIAGFSHTAGSQAVSPGQSAAEDFIAAKMTSAEAAAIADAERRAAAMYQADQLAWFASDYVREKRLVHPRKFRGYVAVPRPDGSGDVYYLRNGGKKPTALLVHLDAQRRPVSHDSIDDVPPDVTIRADALATALAGKPRLCTRTPNTIIFKEGEDWLVYVMSGTDDANAVLIGGHTRMRVSGDASEVLEVEPSANTCFTLERPDTEKGFTPKFAFMTHARSTTPTEFHVFQSLTYRVPFIVGTSTSLWEIIDGRITKLEDREPAAH